jgi:hypothetical protein
VHLSLRADSHDERPSAFVVKYSREDGAAWQPLEYMGIAQRSPMASRTRTTSWSRTRGTASPATRRLPYADFGIVTTQPILAGAGQQTVHVASYGANRLGLEVGRFVHIDLVTVPTRFLLRSLVIFHLHLGSLMRYCDGLGYNGDITPWRKGNKMRLNQIECKEASEPPWPRPASCALKDGVLHFFWGAVAEDGCPKVLKTRPAEMPDSRIWERFTALDGASDERIRAFAEAYGPLGQGMDSVRETIAEWRRYVRAARAVTAAAASIKLGRPVEQADWQTLSEFCLSGAAPSSSRSLPEQKAMIARAMEKFISVPGQFRVSIRWAGDYPDVVLVPTGLLGLIFAQISNAISGSARLDRCAGCGRLFVASRRATTGLRRYCPDCRNRKVDVRDAMRDMRAGVPFRRPRKSTARRAEATPDGPSKEAD